MSDGGLLNPPEGDGDPTAGPGDLSPGERGSADAGVDNSSASDLHPGDPGRTATPGGGAVRSRGPAPEGEGVRIIGATEAAKAVETGEAAGRLGDGQPRFGDRPENPPPDVKPVLRFPLDDSTDAAAIERPRPAPVPEPEGAPGEQPVISVGPPTGEHQLQPWTEPATGEVPKVVIGERTDSEGDDQAAWTAYATGGPRWRDEHDDWAGTDFSDLVDGLGDDDASMLGALDTTARPTQEEFLSFDDLDVPQADLPSVPARGSAADPIKIVSDPRKRPVVPARVGPVTRGPAPRRPVVAAPRAERTGEDPVVPPGGTGARNIPLAILVGVCIAGVAILCFWGGPWDPIPALLLAAVVVTMCGGEFFAAVRRGRFRPITPVGLAAIAAMPIASYAKGEAGIPLVLFMSFFVAAVWYIVGIKTDAPVRDISITLFGIVYLGMLGAYAGLILKIGAVASVPTTDAQGVSILLLACVAAVAYDVGGLFLGSRFGKTTFTAISPNKTLEGLAGGFASAVVAVMIVGTVFGPFTLRDDFFFGVACAFFAPFGDLVESLFKRDLDIKDMGNILPGHGGVLDRFDALLFVLPAAYYATRLILDLG